MLLGSVDSCFPFDQRHMVAMTVFSRDIIHDDVYLYVTVIRPSMILSYMI
jgi:hypothetical protein